MSVERRLPGSRATDSFELLMLPHLGAAFTPARYLLRDAADAEDAVGQLAWFGAEP